MTALRNTLITAGAFYLSIWIALPLEFLIGKLNSRIIYDNTILAAVAMGVMLALGRACAAVFAGMFVTLTILGRKPERWSYLLAILYLSAVAQSRSHWHRPPEAWDIVSEAVRIVVPPIACLAAAFLTAWYRPTPEAPAPRARESQ